MSILFAILLFSLLIFVHELGHFLAAKASGVRVNEFAMFMGPAIFKKQVGETLYSIRCIPIGGFCAMEGEDGGSDDPKAFHRAAWWKRLIILVAGAAMNFIVGVLLFIIVFLPSEQIAVPVIDSFESFCTLDGADGLQVGDEFLQIDGENIYVQSDFSLILSLNEGDVHDVVVLRDGKKVLLDDLKMELHTVKDEQGNDVQRYGFSFSVIEPTFLEKVGYAWDNTLDSVRNIRLSLQMLLTGKAGLGDMTGVVGVVDIMSDVADQSESAWLAVLNMLWFGGFLAVNLAVMNLLPLPALDGGRVAGLLLTTLVEKIIRKKIDPKYEGYIHGVGMILLFALMAVIMFKDIIFIFKG